MRWSAICFAALALAESMAAFAQAPAKPPSPDKKFQVRVPYDGPEIFARLLDHAGLTPIESIDRLGFDAPLDQTIIIVFGDPDPLNQLEFHLLMHKGGGGLGRFLKLGGSLLVATDRGFNFEDIDSLGWRDVKVGGRDFVNGFQNFQGKWQCPTIKRPQMQEPDHPIFANVTRDIATNWPSGVTHKKTLQTLASLPFNGGAGSIIVPPIEPPLLPGVSEAVEPKDYVVADPKRRALLIAGHGVFTNCMTVRDDIDNRRLALNTINWLKDNTRTHVLFINENKAVTNFKLPLTGPPKTPPPLLDLVNRLIDTVQKSEIVQKLINRTIGADRVVRGIVILATLLFLLYGIKKFLQGSWRLEAAAAIVGVPPPKTTPLVKQQVRELAVKQQLGEPAQALARDWLRTYAHVDFSSGQLPRELAFDVHAGVLQRRKLAKHIAALWKLATGRSPANWNATKFRDLAVFLEELSLAAAAGEVVFKPAPVQRGG